MVGCLLLLTAEPPVPARGRCHTVQPSAIADKLKPKTLSLVIIKMFDLSSEHLRNTEFFRAKVPWRLHYCRLLTEGFVLYSVTQNEKQQPCFHTLRGLTTGVACFTWVVMIQSAFLFMLAYLIQPQDRNTKEVSSLCHFTPLAFIFYVQLCTG